MRHPRPQRWIFLAALLVAGPAVAQEEEGFVSLFDGESLDGWVEEGGRYDGDADWSVEDGCIVGRQGPGRKGGLLYTEGLYASFVLRLDVNLDHPFDSGVFLRMAPEGKGAQVTLDHRDGGEIGAVFSDGYLMHNETGEESFRAGEWNQLEVRCTGFDMRIQVTLNGERITDYRLPADSPGYAPTGRIGIQVHGGRDDEGAARFRNLRLRPLGLFGDELFSPTSEDGHEAGTVEATEAARALGWRPLFDGSSLAGWRIAGEPDRYTAERGVLAFHTEGGGGQLETEEDYRDFRLRLEFAMARMANSGLFLRAARDGSNPAFSGCEVQILDDFNWEAVTGSQLQPWQFSGSLYGAVPPGDPEALAPPGEWNTLEVLYRGPRLAVALNGSVLYDVDTHSLPVDPPFTRRAETGFIGLQHHGSKNIEDDVMIRFRNLFVQPLEP